MQNFSSFGRVVWSGPWGGLKIDFSSYIWRILVSFIKNSEKSFICHQARSNRISRFEMTAVWRHLVTFELCKKKCFFKDSLSGFEEAILAHGRWHVSPNDIVNKKWLWDCSIKDFEGWLGKMSDLEPYRILVIENEVSPRKGWVGLEKITKKV